MRGDPFHLQRLLGRDDSPFNGKRRKCAGVRTGCEDQVLSRDGLTVDLYSGRAGYAPPPDDDLNFAGTQQAFNTAVQLVDDAIAVLTHLDHVDAVQCRIDPDWCRFADCICCFSNVQIGLRWDTAAVQACAADLVPFDQSYLEAQLSGPQCCCVASRSGP